MSDPEVIVSQNEETAARSDGETSSGSVERTARTNRSNRDRQVSSRMTSLYVGCNEACSSILRCLGTTNISMIYFIIVLSIGGVLALLVSIKKPIELDESYIHYFLIVCMVIGMVWMLGACTCRTPPLGCCLTRREPGTHIPCYMIFGLTVFCLGSCFISGVDFLSFAYRLSCKNIDQMIYSEGVFDLVKLGFLISQLYFLCRFSDTNFYGRFCTRVFLLHIIAVNLTTWFYFIVNESVVHSSHNYTNCSSLQEMDTFVIAADVYMYPFNIEYTVMSSVLFLLMWCELRKKESKPKKVKKSPTQHTDEKAGWSFTTCCSSVKAGLSKVCLYEERGAEDPQLGDPRTMLFWKSAIIGFVVGILILTVQLVMIVVSAIEYGNDKSSAIYYYVIRIVIFLVMTGVSIWGLCCLPQKRAETISKSKLHTRVDYILIMIGVSGCYIMVCFEVIAAVLDKSEFCDHKNSTSKVSSTTNESSIGKPDMKFCKYVDIFIVDNIVCSLQFSFQAVFIVNALRRRVEEISLANPFSLGVIRNVSAILSLANFGIWAMDTFELKDIKTVGSIETVAYSPSTWRILVHIAYPLCIFFRLHSAFCFFEVVINRFGVTAKPRGYQSIRRLRSGSESVTL